MQVIHTSYIKRMADQTGKTYRDLESIWKKFEREVQNERMFNPNKFSHMRSTDGTIAQEIAKRFEDFLVNPLGTEAENQNEKVDEVQDEIAADEIQDNMEEDIESDLEGELVGDEPDEENITDETVEDTSDKIDNDIEKESTDEKTSDEKTSEDIEPDINMDDFEDLEEL